MCKSNLPVLPSYQWLPSCKNPLVIGACSDWLWWLMFFFLNLPVFLWDEYLYAHKCEFTRKHYITENTNKLFIQAFSSTPVYDPLDNFSSKIWHIIDAVAPTKVQVVSDKRKTEWKNAIEMNKRECRKAERRWWKINLLVHFDSYKDVLAFFYCEQRNAR